MYFFVFNENVIMTNRQLWRSSTFKDVILMMVLRRRGFFRFNVMFSMIIENTLQFEAMTNFFFTLVFNLIRLMTYRGLRGQKTLTMIPDCYFRQTYLLAENYFFSLYRHFLKAFLSDWIEFFGFFFSTWQEDVTGLTHCQIN